MMEFEEIIKWHPYLVLMSERPHTWHGFLTINNTTQFEIQLKVPNYPSMRDNTVNFGDKITLTYGTDFAEKFTVLQQNATCVSSFLSQLQRLLDKTLKQQSVDCNIKADCLSNINLKEIQAVLAIPHITVSAYSDLSTIKLIYKDISISLKRDPNGIHSWLSVSTDLPTLKSWEPLDSCITTLSEAANVLQTRVDTLEDAWFDLRDIDDNCWVLEPVNPQPQHVHRRIYISPTLSILITLDPSNCDSIPDIKVFGSDLTVVQCKETMHENWDKWNNDDKLHENLMVLLDINEFPKCPNTVEPSQDINGIVRDNECGICFSIDTDNEEYPSVVCNNKKCQRNFHTSCLLKWLRSVASNEIMFDQVHGTCTYCKEQISCRLVN